MMWPLNEKRIRGLMKCSGLGLLHPFIDDKRNNKNLLLRKMPAMAGIL